MLLDTHALLWFITEHPSLPGKVRDNIIAHEAPVFASAASAWEISIKASLGKLQATGNLIDEVVESGLTWMEITPTHAMRAGSLPYHHRDPFDRLLVAQALEADVPLVTVDAVLEAYGVRLWWG